MNIDFTKHDLIPAVVQDSHTRVVLMVGFMNEEALKKTEQEKVVTFFSRSKNRLWTKGESSGNRLLVDSIKIDCDSDTILIHARPTGPICHTGKDTCFSEENLPVYGFLGELMGVIRARMDSPDSKSYVSTLYSSGMKKIAQKVGEEATELILEDATLDRERFLAESADLLFHYLIFLEASGVGLNEVVEVLKGRQRKG